MISVNLVITKEKIDLVSYNQNIGKEMDVFFLRLNNDAM